MATFTNKNLDQGQIANSETTEYTVPGSTSAVVSSIFFCNTSASAVTFSVSMVPSGGSAGDSNRIISDLSLAAGDTFTLTGPLSMDTGDFLSMIASAATSITFTVSGVEIT